MSIEISGFNHSSVTVADLDRTIAFFVDGLGFELQSRAPRDPRVIERMTGLSDVEIEIAFVAGPGHRIELITYRGPPDRGAVNPRMCDVGAAHIGFDVADMDAALAVAAQYEFALLSEVVNIDAGPNAGRRVAYVRDGDGITFEFLELAGGGA
jgi:catechol 2,3-dioxygenase-like lactoylglutathione lyase family enzyme